MKSKKVLALLILILFCTASPTIAEDMELCTKISALQDEAAYFVAYGKENGQPIAIIESLGFDVVKEGKSATISVDELVSLLDRLGKRGEKNVDIISSTTFFVHGSPGCYIKTASGGWKCICPR